MPFMSPSFTAEKLIVFLQQKNSLDECLKKYPWLHLKKGESSKLFEYIQKAEPDSQTAFLLLRYLVYAPHDLWLKAKAALMILGHPLLTLEERHAFLEVIQEILVRIQQAAASSASSSDGPKAQLLQARFLEETGKYLVLTDRREEALEVYNRASALYQQLNKPQKVEKINAELHKVLNDVDALIEMERPAIEAQIHEKREELARLEARLEGSRVQKTETELELAGQRRELGKVQKQVEQTQTALIESQKALGLVQAEAQRWQNELQEKRLLFENQALAILKDADRLTGLSEEVRQQEAMLAALKQQVGEHELQRDRQNESIAQAQKIIDELELKKNALLDAFSQDSQEFTDLRAVREEVKRLMAGKDRLEDEIFDLQNRLTQAQKRLEQREKEEVSLTDNWGQVREQVDRLSIKRDQLLLDVEGLEAQKLEHDQQIKIIASAMQEMDATTAELQSLTQKKEGLQQEIAQAEIRLKLAQQALAEAEQQRLSAEQAEAGSLAYLQSIQSTTAQLEIDQQNLTEKQERVTREVWQKQRELEQIQQAIQDARNELREQNEKAQAEVQENQERIERFQEQVRELENRIQERASQRSIEDTEPPSDTQENFRLDLEHS